MLERYRTRKAAVGAGLIAYALLGVPYWIAHDPSPNFHQPRVGQDCQTTQVENTLVTQCDGGVKSYDFDAASYTNHGPFATLDNFVDDHTYELDTLSGLSMVLGAALLAQITIAGRRKSQPSAIANLFIQRVAKPDMYYVEGIGDIPLLRDHYPRMLAKAPQYE